MGAAASSGLRAETYAQKAALSKQLADKILMILFSRADFRDLLSLANLQSCPNYVFTTAQALDTLFQKIQIEPQKGKQGEIYFAPVARLAPGRSGQVQAQATQPGSPSQAQIIQERNRMCLDIAYFYVRIFQIYAALALSVLDTDPTRKPTSGYYAPRPGRAVGPERAVFFGGGRSVVDDKGRSDVEDNADADDFEQKGGAIPASSAEGKYLITTSLAPLLKYESKQDHFSNTVSIGNNKLIIGFKKTGILSFDWTSPSDTSSIYLSGTFETPNNIIIPVSMEMKKEGSRIDFLLNGRKIMDFVKSSDGWKYKCDGSSNYGSEQQKFLLCILKSFQQYPEIGEKQEQYQQLLKKVSEKRQPGIQIPGFGFSTGSSGTGSTAGIPKHGFESYDELRKLFDARFKGGPFPKAFATARAMTLLNPIFNTELVNPQQPFFSEICSLKPDFDKLGAMPRPGVSPRANIYFKSLVSLFYDDYRETNGEIIFTKTESGNSNLKNASRLLAQLYNVKDKQDEFIESQKFFPTYSLCQRHKSNLIEIKRDKAGQQFVNLLRQEVIVPLLQFQDQHNIVVNKFLAKMFEVKGDTLKFSAGLRNGGRAAVDALSKEAAALLLNYYLKSEAFFIKGIVLYENAQQVLIGTSGGQGPAPVPAPAAIQKPSVQALKLKLKP